jgi:hypothetical protein
MLLRIEPIRLICTMRSWPCVSATMPTMSSTALPKLRVDQHVLPCGERHSCSRCVQQAAERLAELERDLLSGISQQLWSRGQYRRATAVRDKGQRSPSMHPYAAPASRLYAPPPSTHLGQRHDGQEVDAKDGGRAPVQVLGGKAERHKDEEQVEPGAGEQPPERADEARLRVVAAAAAVRGQRVADLLRERRALGGS